MPCVWRPRGLRTLAAVAEVVTGCTQSAAVFFGQFLFLIILVNHDFEQMNDGGEFAGVQLAGQFMGFGGGVFEIGGWRSKTATGFVIHNV